MDHASPTSAKPTYADLLEDLDSVRFEQTPCKNTPRKEGASRCTCIALAVAAVAGIALIAVAACLFPFGSAAFLGLLIPGLALTAASAAGLIGVVITSCQQRRQEALLTAQLHNEALAFAEKALQEEHYCTAILCSFSGSEIAQPLDKRIAELHTLRTARFLPDLRKAMESAEDPVWSDPTVVEALDALLKIDYAMGDAILEELPRFLSQCPTGFAKEDALTESDCYQPQTFPALLVDYHLIRSEPTRYFQFASSSPNPAFSSPFYQQGTPPCNWRLLYNNYCNSLRSIRLPNSYKQWAIPDTNPKTFLSKPTADLPWPWDRLKA